MEQVGHPADAQSLDAVFAALADPTRRAILSQLAAGDASVNEIAAPFAISQPAVSKHLKVLERAGLIERNVDRQRRPARLARSRLSTPSPFDSGSMLSTRQRNALLLAVVVGGGLLRFAAVGAPVNTVYKATVELE